MRTTPKYFLILALTAGAALTAYGCASDGPPTAPSTSKRIGIAQTNMQDVHAKYDWIGKYHTDGLAYVYSQLARGKGKARSHADLCRIAAKATKEFHKAQRHGEVPAGLVDPALVNDVCPDGDAGKTSKTVLVSGVKRQNELSAGAANLIDQITYITNTATSRTAFVTGILKVEDQAAYLPPDDAGAVIAVASVALSSREYWEANLDAWTGLSTSMGTMYSVSPGDMTGATVLSITGPLVARRYAVPWWQNPYIRGFRAVLFADAMGAARSIYASWYMGPIGWDAAAASALFASVTTALALLF